MRSQTTDHSLKNPPNDEEREGSRVEMWISSQPVDQPSHWSGVWATTDVQRSVRALVEGHDPVHRLLRRLVQGLRPGRALDHGCGFGRVGIYMAAQGWDVVGVDLSHPGLMEARSQTRDVSFISGDVRTLPFEDEAFDCVVSIGVIEHLQEGPSLGLQELARTLREGGRALITVPQDNLWRRTIAKLARHLASSWLLGCAAARIPPPSRLPEGFYQYSFRLDEFAPLLAKSGLQVDFHSHYGISHGLAETRVGAAGEAAARRRFGGTDVTPKSAVSASRSPLRMEITRRLRAVYDETGDDALSQAYIRVLGPLFGHMMAFVVTKR